MQKFSLEKLTKDQKKLRKRILEISHESHLSHLGSCLSAVDTIDAIYKIKNTNDLFILSNGHAGIAWYVVLEKHGFINNSSILKDLHIHPDRNTSIGISVSTGSLGQGLPIALGLALANKKRIVYCMISDGECAEGSIWEAFRIAYENKINNLRIIINANGWAAYNSVDIPYLIKRIKSFGFTVKTMNGHNSKDILEKLKKISSQSLTVVIASTTVEQFPFLKGQNAHYYILNQEDFDLAFQSLL